MMLAAVPGFTNNQSSLNPVGPGAGHIEHEFALIFWITVAVYVLVTLYLVFVVARRRHSLDLMPEPMPTSDEGDRTARRSVTISVVATVVLLFIMMIGS